MLLNLSIIQHYLPEHFQATLYGDEDPELYLKLPFLYANEMGLSPNSLYITQNGSFPSSIKCNKVGFIHIGSEIPEIFKKADLPFLYIKETAFVSIIEVFNAVQTVFDRINKWAYKLTEEMISDDFDMKQLIYQGVKLLHSPFVFMDASLRCKYTSKVSVNPDGTCNVSISDVPVPLRDSVLKNFRGHFVLEKQIQNPYFSNMHAPYEDNLYPAYCQNIFLHGYYIGCAMFLNINGPFTSGELSLANHFFELFKKAHERLFTSSKFHNSNSVIMDKLLSNSQLNTDEYKKMQLSPDSNWIVFRLAGAFINKSVKKEYLCGFLNIYLPDQIFVTIHSNTIIGLLKVPSTNDWKNSKIIQTLNNISICFGYCCGISNRFSSLYDIHYYKAQADFIIGKAKTLSENNVTIFFDEHIFEYMLYILSSQAPLSTLQTEGITALLESDKTKNTEYAKSLGVWLDNECNVSSTANEFFIHHSSFQKRIKKIEQISGDNLDDPETKMYYRLFLRLMKENGSI